MSKGSSKGSEKADPSKGSSSKGSEKSVEEQLQAVEGQLQSMRRLKNELYCKTVTRPGCCTMPPMVIPVIPDNDPGADLRTNRLNRELAVQEAKLAHINKHAVGIGKRAV